MPSKPFDLSSMLGYHSQRELIPENIPMTSHVPMFLYSYTGFHMHTCGITNEYLLENTKNNKWKLIRRQIILFHINNHVE